MKWDYSVIFREGAGRSISSYRGNLWKCTKEFHTHLFHTSNASVCTFTNLFIYIYRSNINKDVIYILFYFIFTFTDLLKHPFGSCRYFYVHDPKRCLLFKWRTLTAWKLITQNEDIHFSLSHTFLKFSKMLKVVLRHLKLKLQNETTDTAAQMLHEKFRRNKNSKNNSFINF